MTTTIQTPLELEFQDLTATPEIRKLIAAQVDILEQRYGRVTACKIVVKGPGNRHHTGGLNEITIRLALPHGHEVNVGRTPKADERHADLTYAINDAFKRARRQLQDQARRMRGEVKAHAG
ncbi:MAG: HPF/RaiA family ribosome-associated protein [Xanthobacteraceae bacterium]|nr:HPF/RaiA family ribosome-associated protein [Xanthobacteraceae bacterium]